MTDKYDRKKFISWQQVDPAVMAELAEVLKKHGLEFYRQEGITASPGVYTLADDPIYAEMDALAAGSAPQVKPIVGEQK